MRILITGTNGQLGFELAQSLAPYGELICPNRETLDLSQAKHIGRALTDYRADLIINSAAYTAVDRAESEADLAMAVNHDAPAEIAAYCAAHGIPLVHFSTDYVYGGSGTERLSELADVNPCNQYARSKLAGEKAIQASGCNHLIFRTSWVYANRGNNFVRTMLRLANTHPELRIVDDQVGAPTTARMLADSCAFIIAQTLDTTDNTFAQPGLYNLAASGETNWYEFAQAIFEHREQLSGGDSPNLTPISTEQYPLPANRPSNSRLDLTKICQTFACTLPDWQHGLRHTMAGLLA